MNNLHLRDGKVAFRWKRWRNKKRQEVSYCLMVLFSGAVLLGAGGMAAAGPTGGQVTSGTGTISQAGTTTTIDQTSNVLDINWQTFSTAPNEAVNFNQPGSTSLAINRVIGGVPSYLQGALNANGRVFILNSAGVTFTGTSHVNVGALLATTAMSVGGDPNQLASFSAPAGSYGSVINEGSITVSNGGFAILAAPYVQNTGFIKADLGTVALAGTNSFTLDLRGDGLINFVVPPGAAEQIAADGKRVGVDNSGTLQARSGQVIVSASVATQVVNAVVNLTGVVDADALAANGAGGSVLVTSTGDINLGGTVTAQGNGTGAGGQIVTKAAALDNIEQGAIVNAAGGSQGGKGGLVEVSGHDVKVVGSVHAGAGGKLIIDPATIDIVPSGASNGTDIFTEAFVKAHTASSLLYSAAKDIVFTATGPSHTLALTGGGALVLKAGSSIIFDAGNYIIDNGAAAVRMTATNGDIGNTTHRLSVISSVSQAGDIVLNALGGSIYLQDVTVKSLGGNGHDAHAKFSANADNTINIAGAVDVEATVDGDTAVHADALANLHAFDITVNGPVTVLANAVGFGIDVTEQANAEFYAIANTASVDGKVELGNTLDVEAHINGSEAVNLLLATASVELNGTRVDVVGNTKVIASAADFADPFSVDAHANLFVHAAPSFSISTVGGVILDRILGGTQDFSSASIHFHHGIDVEANAFVPLASAVHVTASANVVLDAAHITVDGPAKVAASATAHSAGQMVANAFLLAQLGQAHFAASGSVSTTGGAFLFSGRVAGTAHVGANDVTFGNTITVSANAHTFAHSANGVRADAEAHLAGFSVDVAGKVTVDANATNSGDGQVSAEALLLVDYADVQLVATASNFDGVLQWVDSNIGGSIADLIGNFIDHSGSRSSDAVQVNLAAHLGGSTVNLEDGLDVEALAKATHDGIFFTPGNVTALASATLAGRLITVAGPAVVNASAVGSSHDGFVDAKARLVTDLIGADGTIAFGHIEGSPFSAGTFSGTDVSLKFDAHFGGGTSGSDSFIAGETKFVNGFDVTAFANGFDVAGVKAEASAHLVTDDLDVFSSATVSASAQGEEVFFGVGAVSRLTADNLDFTLSSPELVGVGSSRTLVQFRLGGSDVSFQKGFDVQAYANGLGLDIGSVYADAGVTLAAHSHQVQQSTTDGGTSTFGVGGNVRIGGPATVKATANGSYADTVRAEATLIAEGGSFSTNYSGKANDFASHFAANSVNFSAVDVETKVYGNEIRDSLVGSAWGEFFANHVNMNGQVAVKANTVHHSNDGSHEPYVVANAVLIAADRDSSSADGCCGPDARTREVIGSGASVTFNQGIDVEANANGSLAFGVTARAFVELEASTGERFAVTLVPNSSGHGDITVNGNIEVLANASGHRNHFSDEGFVGASADFSARGSIRTFSSGTDYFYRDSRSEARNITLTNNLDVEANANGRNLAFVGAFADASLDAFDSESVGGVAKVKANAQGSTADGVEAEADLETDPGFLNFAGGFDVEANANGQDAFRVCAFATASLDAYSALVGGPAVVLANAHGTSVDGVEAGARIETDAGYLTFSNGFDVEANASEFQTADGHYRGFFVEAYANASLDAYSVNVAGQADVRANAHGTSVDGVEARAEIFTDPVFLTFAKGFDVEANATDDFGFQVTANATADFGADFINVGGRGIVLANAHGDSMDGVTASAFLLVEATTANFANGFDVEAKANGLNTRENEVAWASANFSLDGLSVGGPAGQGAKVIASATEFNTHDGGANEVVSVARLRVGGGSNNSYHGPSYGSFEHFEASTAVFNGGIDVEAHTVASDTRFVGASASAVISARHIGIGHGATVKETDSAFFASSVDGAAKLVVDGGSEGYFNSSASGRHRFYFPQFHFNADTANVQGINVQAQTRGVEVIDRSFVGAFGSASVFADHVGLFGVTQVTATATGDEVEEIRGDARLHIGDGTDSYDSIGPRAGSVYVQGPIRVGGYANVTSTGIIIPLVDGGSRVGEAFATADVDIDAKHNIVIFGSGGYGPNYGGAITAVAIADPQHLADHAEAYAYVEAEADASTDHSAGGNLTIVGNVTAQAIALGIGPHNVAYASIGSLSSAGLAGDNVTIDGNIRALAFADSSGDDATARIKIEAYASHGHILLIETQDPIASAIAGDPAHAFKQSHVTTNTQVVDGLAFASANIIIQAGPDDSGSVVVEPPNQDQIQALRAIVTEQPPGGEGSSGLNLIPLTIRHHDCGLLGGAGNPNGAGGNCDQGPYDITETDTLP